MIEPQVQWVAPASLWPGYAGAANAGDRARLRVPHILRFATDAFMDEFMTTLQNQPQRLHEWRVRPETWEGPASGPTPAAGVPPLLRRVERMRLASVMPLTGSPNLPALTGTVAEGEELKLYQPAHQRFYLVSACLVCRLPGMPDRALNFGAGERAGYVVRRLRPKAGADTAPDVFSVDDCDEYAFVGGNRWQPVAADRLAPGEEVQPLFGVTYVETDGRRRRVLAGTIPVGKRETYLGAAMTRILPATDAPEPVDPRKALLLRKVTDPWRSMIEYYDKQYADAARVLKGDTAGIERLQTEATDLANYLSWYLLLDLADFLAKYLQPVWDVIRGAALPATLAGSADAKTLYDTLFAASYTAPGGTARRLTEVLAAMPTWRNKLESATAPYSTVSQPPDRTPTPAGIYPDFIFALQSAGLRTLVFPPAGVRTLDDLIAAALKAVTAPQPMPPLPLAAEMTMLDLREPGWFIIRCVFERPNCVPLAAPLLSEPTEPFQMAAFFDPQAPARPIRINLPLDTTAAGLRKFDKNTAFMISDALCGQMKRMGNITFTDLVLSALPPPLHKDLPIDEGSCEDGANISFGLICSLSIPIITICALILLMIIVNLLNFVFHWLPFFISCFPLPRFSAKET